MEICRWCETFTSKEPAPRGLRVSLRLAAQFSGGHRSLSPGFILICHQGMSSVREGGSVDTLSGAIESGWDAWGRGEMWGDGSK
ncbi:hypothetical protein RRG08_060834 [Elysia crispata]|uniref:Uncharacterized protein n=1 Tax=Elysia crispata TaxID=231223 RepID=A0AAE0ZFP8_9GAST|nr:hypothetical protein RRG08_060834 [Elysia crispata]